MRIVEVISIAVAFSLWGCGSQTKESPDKKTPAETTAAEKKPFEWTVMDEAGKTSTSPGSLQDLGVAIYPGATVQPEPAKPMRMDLASGSEFTVGFVTADAPQKVMDFYKGEAKSGSSAKLGETLTFIGETKQGDGLQVIAVTDKESNQTIITASVKKKKK